MKTTDSETIDLIQNHTPEQQQIAQLTEQVQVLTQRLEWFERQIFGQKSEKQHHMDGRMDDLFAALSLTENPTTPEQEETDVKAHKRKSHKKFSGDEVNDTGLRFDDSVPQQIIDVPAPELLGCDAHLYEIIDYKETCRLAQMPGSYKVLIYRRPVLRHKDQATVCSAPAPSNVLDGCYADVSLIAGMMVDKAVYHLPLYRQHQRMLNSGITISRATLINWMHKGCELLRPIYQAQLKSILASAVLAMDEVPMKAGRKEDKPGKMQTSYFWPMLGDKNEVAFTWSPSRGMKHAIDQLQDFKGTLVTDGYAAYTGTVKKLNIKEQRIIHAACWVHMRRYFEKSLKMEPKESQYVLDEIAKLYKIEKHVRKKEFSLEKLQEYRSKHSENIVTELFEWMYEQRQRVDLLDSNPLRKALNYAHERIVELKVFLANPAVEMDTNHLERALRVIPMGRKNHLFCWSELGAEQLGILQSLTVTCRMLGINPYHYLVDVLQRVAMHPASKVEELTPRLWQETFKNNFLTSDIEN